MEIPLKYKLTNEILSLISQVEVQRTRLETIKVPEELIRNLQRKSILKSSLFSAKIEGNTLNLSDIDDLDKFDPNKRERIEIENILSGFSFIKAKQKVDIDFILDLHKIVMKNLADSPGSFRKEPSAIFNQSGFAVYIPPPPSQITELTKRLISYIQKDTNENIFIKSIVSHMCFEKIHPFLDGNGRVGRLLIWAMFINANYSFNGLVSIEEALNERKEEYYAYLDKNDSTSFIEFMLEVILYQSKSVFNELENREFKKEDLLLPRRKEILEIIRDHQVVSLDFLKRRFLKVSERMIRFDLEHLEREGFVVKMGATRGARYKLK